MREAGDERSRRDDGDDGDEKMRAAVGTRSRSSVTLTPRDAPAVGVELKEKKQASCCRRNRTRVFTRRSQCVHRCLFVGSSDSRRLFHMSI